MEKTTSNDHKHRYAMARHHAWAGSVLLAVLLALRVFFLTWENDINETIFIIIGVILIIYILIALLLTYRYRSAITAETQTVLVNTSDASIEVKLQKNRILWR